MEVWSQVLFHFCLFSAFELLKLLSELPLLPKAHTTPNAKMGDVEEIDASAQAKEQMQRAWQNQQKKVSGDFLVVAPRDIKEKLCRLSFLPAPVLYFVGQWSPEESWTEGRGYRDSIP